MPLLSRRCKAALCAAAWVAAWVGAGAAQAQDQEDVEPVGPKSLWEFGAAGAGGSRPAYPGSDTRLTNQAAAPYAIYRGKFLRVGEGGLRVRARKDELTELDIGVSGSLGSDSDEVQARAGMPNLGTLIELGPRLKIRLPSRPSGARVTLSLPLRAVFDLSDSFRDRGYTFEPGLSVGWRPWAQTSVGVGLTAFFGDRRINQLFYGVDPLFATLTRDAFEARSGLIATRLSLSASTALSRDVYFGSYLRFDSVRGAANEDSPLVRKTEGLTAGVGLSWTLFRSERPAED